MNESYYNDLLSMFYIHPCYMFKVMSNLSQHSGIFNQDLLLNLIMKKFTHDETYYKSYLYSMTLLFLKHEYSNLIHTIHNNNVSFFSRSIFKVVYGKVLTLCPKRQEFYLKIKDLIFKRLIQGIKKQWEVIVVNSKKYFTRMRLLNQMLIQIFQEIIGEHFVLRNKSSLVDDFLISLNRKIYKSIKKNYKK